MRSDRARHADLISQDPRIPEHPSALPYLLQALSDSDIGYCKLAQSLCTA